MGDLKDPGGHILTSDEEKVDAFQDHHLSYSGLPIGPLPPAPAHTASPPPKKETVRKVRAALARTKANSSPSPDGISYRLLRLVKDTTLGRAVIDQVASWVDTGQLPDYARGMKMLMIPKPGKRHDDLKGFRPIVLAQTVGKLSDKVVADTLQSKVAFHHLQYGGRKNRSATDALMAATSLVERAVKSGHRATSLGKDIVSAFNHLRKEETLDTLRETGLEPNTLRYVERFLMPRSFQIAWDHEARGSGHMDQGTPQGSPLSPVLFLAFIARTLKAVDRRLALPEAHNPSIRLLARPTPRRGLTRQLGTPNEVHLFS